MFGLIQKVRLVELFGKNVFGADKFHFEHWNTSEISMLFHIKDSRFEFKRWAQTQPWISRVTYGDLGIVCIVVPCVPVSTKPEKYSAKVRRHMLRLDAARALAASIQLAKECSLRSFIEFKRGCVSLGVAYLTRSINCFADANKFARKIQHEMR